MLVLLFADDKSCFRPLGLIQGLGDKGQSEVKLRRNYMVDHYFKKMGILQFFYVAEADIPLNIQSAILFFPF